ncbi:hypothetical protein M3221_07505 [Domibacillus indicus]|uniref:hypothetical protein n=1 Tax=Domibacillus indicus TaxID=1437523 RepID=UPI00203C3608|nr:hypothetical protein [Domibacillus indicus]MCM3788247.1 hypothetical protein [Domibacillus indicus]
MEKKSLNILITEHRAKQKEHQDKAVAPPELRASAKEIFERAKEEAVVDYEEKLPAVLAEIEAAKAHYLYAIASYSALKKGVNQKIIEAGREVGNDFQALDLPNLRDIAWYCRDDDQADGSKYTVFEDEIRKAISRVW